MDSKRLTPEPILDMARSYWKSRILLTAFELGIFSELGNGEKPAGEVAAALGTDERATHRLMCALCALEFLELKGDCFKNAPLAAEFLDKSKPKYLGMLMHMANLWEPWGTLTEAVKRGGCVVDPSVRNRGKEYLRAFIGAMHARARSHAVQLPGFLELEGVSRVLDIGGGSGVYSMAMVKAKAGLRATVFDLPETAALTREYIEAEGLKGRMDAVDGDLRTGEFGGGFDLAFVSAIIHMLSPEENAALLRKIVLALNPGGRVVIQDFIMEPDRVTPPFGAQGVPSPRLTERSVKS